MPYYLQSLCRPAVDGAITESEAQDVCSEDWEVVLGLEPRGPHPRHPLSPLGLRRIGRLRSQSVPVALAGSPNSRSRELLLQVDKLGSVLPSRSPSMTAPTAAPRVRVQRAEASTARRPVSGHCCRPMAAESNGTPERPRLNPDSHGPHRPRPFSLR